MRGKKKSSQQEQREPDGKYLPKISDDGYERLKKDELNDRGVQKLIEAVVVRAVDDWRMGKLKEKTFGRRPGVVMETERFFKSGWFYMLTGLDGKAILEKMERDL